MLLANFLGDLNIGGNRDWSISNEIKQLLGEADVNYGNLEGAIIEKGMKGRKKISCYSLVENAGILSDLKLDAVSLANNHITDYGYDGLRSTMEFLKKMGILFCGAGANLEEASRPAILTRKGKKIVLFSFGWEVIDCIHAGKHNFGIAPLKEKFILECIRDFRKQADIILLSLHFGYENETFPLPYHRQMCHRLIEGGADLIIGHHPHVVQGKEFYRQKIIFYSLGNFMFSSLSEFSKKHRWNVENKSGCILQCEFAGNNDILDVCVIPTFQDERHVVRLMSMSKKNEFLSVLQGQENALSLDSFEYKKYWRKFNRRRLPDPRKNDAMTKASIILCKLAKKAPRIAGKK